MSTATETSRPARRAVLRPVLSERFALAWPQAAMVISLAVLFVYLSYVPLAPTELWGHVQRGQWILEHRALPVDDPVMPLAAGTGYSAGEWLSQVVLAAVYAASGPQGLANLYALAVFATYVVLARVFYLQSGRPSLALCGMLLVFASGWTRHATLRPETFGGLALVVLLWMLVYHRPWRLRARGLTLPVWTTSRFVTWGLWIGTPLLFVLWANSDASFLLGIGVLACHAVGRAAQVLWHKQSVKRLLADRRVRRWVWLTELAIAASLISPYGLKSLGVFASGTGSLSVWAADWQPLTVASLPGAIFAVSMLLLLFVLRRSLVSLQPTEVLLVVGIALATTIHSAALIWFGPVFIFVIMPHLADVLNQRRRQRSQMPLPGTEHRPLSARDFRLTLACVLVVWTAFAVSPISQPVLGGAEREVQQIHSPVTPMGVSQFLREHPPRGQIYNPAWWGDWLAWDGPANLAVFMASRTQRAPATVWRDYLDVTHARGDWESILGRYAVETIVVDKARQPRLFRAVRQSGAWQAVYEDSQAVVFRQKGSAG